MGKIVVLGANGFIGRHLTLALAQSSLQPIVAFDRFSSYKAGTDHPFERYEHIEIVPGDFFNRSEVAEVIEGATYVFHLISSTNPATSNDDPFVDIDTNIRSSVELFQLCVEYKVKKIIFLSSGGTVYGDIDHDRIDETTLAQPHSPYGIGKLAIEHYLRYFKTVASLDYVIYRLANPYGPGQNILGKQGVIPIFMHHMLTKEPITIFGQGDMVRDYIYIDDLVNMILQTYTRLNQYDEYNLGSGQGITVKQIIEAIEDCAGFKAKKRHVEAPPTYTQKSVLDDSRFRQEFNLSATTSLEEGLKRTWDYVKTID